MPLHEKYLSVTVVNLEKLTLNVFLVILEFALADLVAKEDLVKPVLICVITGVHLHVEVLAAYFPANGPVLQSFFIDFASSPFPYLK